MHKCKVTILLILYCIVNVFALHSVIPTVILGIQDSTIASYQQGQCYVDIILTQPIGNLSLYGNYRNEMNFLQWQPFRFAPVQDYYTVGASYDFDFMVIRLEHMCMHPVVSKSSWSGLQGGYTKFEVQL